MNTPETFEKYLWDKKIFGLRQEDGTVEIVADCSVYPDATVRFRVPGEAARIYFTEGVRESVQTLFPALAPELREILVSGTSPAEWDSRVSDKPMPETEEEFKDAYRPRGYVFPDDPEGPAEESKLAVAGKLYDTYCEAVGGKAFNGDPLPAWEDFRADTEKTPQSDAWMVVAEHALRPVMKLQKELEESRRETEGAWANRDRFCAAINEIGKDILGFKTDNCSEGAVVRETRFLVDTLRKQSSSRLGSLRDLLAAAESGEPDSIADACNTARFIIAGADSDAKNEQP